MCVSMPSPLFVFVCTGVFVVENTLVFLSKSVAPPTDIKGNPDSGCPVYGIVNAHTVNTAHSPTARQQQYIALVLVSGCVRVSGSVLLLACQAWALLRRIAPVFVPPYLHFTRLCGSGAIRVALVVQSPNYCSCDWCCAYSM